MTGPRFCWACGRQLRFPHAVRKVVDGHERTLHKSCAKGKGERPDYEMLELLTKKEERQAACHHEYRGPRFPGRLCVYCGALEPLG